MSLNWQQERPYVYYAYDSKNLRVFGSRSAAVVWLDLSHDLFRFCLFEVNGEGASTERGVAHSLECAQYMVEEAHKIRMTEFILACSV